MDMHETLSRSQLRNKQRKHTRQCLLTALAFVKAKQSPSLAHSVNQIDATDLENFRQHIYDKDFGVQGKGGHFTTQQVVAETVSEQTLSSQLGPEIYTNLSTPFINEWQAHNRFSTPFINEWQAHNGAGIDWLRQHIFGSDFGAQGKGGRQTTQQVVAETVPIQTSSPFIEVEWDTLVFKVCGDELQDTTRKYIDKCDHSVLSGGEANQDGCGEPSESSYSDESVAPDGRFLYHSEADEEELDDVYGESEEEDTASSCTSDLGNGEGNETGQDERKDTDKGNRTYGTQPEVSAAPLSPSSESRLSRFFTVKDLLACRTACPRSYMQATNFVIGKYRGLASNSAGHGHTYSANETGLLLRERRLTSSMLQLAASRKPPSFVQQIVACHEAAKAQKHNKPG